MCTLNTRRIVRGKGTERSDERLTTGNSLSAQGLGSRCRLYGPRTPNKIKSNESFGMGSMAKVRRGAAQRCCCGPSARG